MTSAQEKSGKRVGRPAKNPALGKRINAMFRLNEATRDRLMAAAEQSGRSMSEEIERRIDRSFEDVDLMLSYFGKAETLKLAHAIAMLARTVEARSGRDWTSDATTKADLSGAISRFFYVYFHEQDEENSVASAQAYRLEDMGRAHAAAESVAEALGLKSKAREKMDAFLETPEGKAVLERLMADKGAAALPDQKKD